MHPSAHFSLKGTKQLTTWLLIPLDPHKVRTNFLSNLLVLCSKQHPYLTYKVPRHFFHFVKVAIQSLSKTVSLC